VDQPDHPLLVNQPNHPVLDNQSIDQSINQTVFTTINQSRVPHLLFADYVEIDGAADTVLEIRQRVLAKHPELLLIHRP
jgi:hypothetical protein